MSKPPSVMGPDRLSAFTDAVIAIIITIMVLELRVPEGDSWEALRSSLPLFAAYALSFLNVGIFWVNHHHMLHHAKRIDGYVLLANLFLLFWLSLVPFVIRWIGEGGIGAMPVAAYGLVLVMASFGYLVLERAIIAAEGGHSALAIVLGSKKKEELISFLFYMIAIPLAFVWVWGSVLIYLGNALYWMIPDRRVEKTLLDV